jgi:hypothetical protein
MPHLTVFRSIILSCHAKTPVSYSTKHAKLPSLYLSFCRLVWKDSIEEL